MRRRRAASARPRGAAVPASYFQHLPADARLVARGSIPRGSTLRISARNQIKGTVVEVKKGATTSHVRVFDAFASREPVPTSLENALDQGSLYPNPQPAIVLAGDIPTGRKPQGPAERRFRLSHPWSINV